MSSINYNPSYSYYTSSSAAAAAALSNTPTSSNDNLTQESPTSSSSANALTNTSTPSNTITYQESPTSSSSANALTNTSTPSNTITYQESPTSSSSANALASFSTSRNPFDLEISRANNRLLEEWRSGEIDQKGVLAAIKARDLNKLRSLLPTPMHQENLGESMDLPLLIVYAAEKGYCHICEFLLDLTARSRDVQRTKVSRLVASITKAIERGKLKALQYLFTDPLNFFPGTRSSSAVVAATTLQSPPSCIQEDEETSEVNFSTSNPANINIFLSPTYSDYIIKYIENAILDSRLNVVEFFLKEFGHLLTKSTWNQFLCAAISGADLETFNFFWNQPNVRPCLTRGRKEIAIEQLLGECEGDFVEIMKLLLTTEPAVSEDVLKKLSPFYYNDITDFKKKMRKKPLYDWVVANKNHCKLISTPKVYEDPNHFSLHDAGGDLFYD